MARAYVGMGSNVGAREAHLSHALRRLEGGPLTEVVEVSSVYETDPVGYEDQPAFLNMVAGVETALEPGDLLSRLRSIEAERGRVRTFRNGPRTLDLDILLYDDLTIARPGLCVPHPRMGERDFVLVPLLEIAPYAVEPGTGTRYETYRSDPPSGVHRVMTAQTLMEQKWE